MSSPEEREAASAEDASIPAPGVARPPEPEDSTQQDRTLIGDVTSTLAGAAHAGISAARPLIEGVEGIASGARRAIGERSGARVRRVRRMGSRPLANLWELHPEARRAAIRELGVQTVPVENIAGTAVEGAPQRGGDFLPLRSRRGADWRARWQRILKAVEGLANLPPVELVKFGEEYWVVDGHNRVAAALYNGQVAIDAEVEELRLPGVSRAPNPTAIASVLQGSSDVRQAGAGRLTRTTSRPHRVPARATTDQDRSKATESRPAEDDVGPRPER